MKKIYTIFILALALVLPARAQVFMIDGNDNYRAPEDPEVFANLPSEPGLATDYFAPVGDGLLLLTALGGAYLLGKRKNENK